MFDTPQKNRAEYNIDHNSPSLLSKLPALVIKGSGHDVAQPLNREDAVLSKRVTGAYALSPKLIKQFRLEDKI